MLDREKALAAARGCLGTPFHHQGRQPGMGLDCIGLVIHALREGGMIIDDDTAYGRQSEAGRLEAALEAHGFEKTETARAGAVLLFRLWRSPQHVALVTAQGRIIHAYAPQGCVVETDTSAFWQRRLYGIYDLKDG